MELSSKGMGDTLSTLGSSLPDISLPDISSVSLPEISIPSPGDLSFPSGTVTTFWNYTLEFSKPGTYSVVTPNQFSSTHILLWDTDCLFCEVFEQGNFFFGKRRRRRDARGRMKKRKRNRGLMRRVSLLGPRHLPGWRRTGRGRFRDGTPFMRSSHIPSITHLSRRRGKQIQVRTKYIPRIPRYVTRDPKNSKLAVPAKSFAPPTVSPVYRAPRSSSSTKTSPNPLPGKVGTSKRLTTTSAPSIAVAPVYLESYHSLPRPAKEPGPYKNYFYELPIPRKEDDGGEEVEEDEQVKEKEERKLTNEALVDVASLKNLLTISRDFLQFLLASLGLWRSEADVGKTKKEEGEDTLEKALRLTGIVILGSLGILLQQQPE